MLLYFIIVMGDIVGQLLQAAPYLRQHSHRCLWLLSTAILLLLGLPQKEQVAVPMVMVLSG